MNTLNKLQSQQTKLEFALKNAIKSGNKAKAAWAIVQLEQLSEEIKTLENTQVLQPIAVGEIFCVMNADKNLIFGWYEIEKATEKAIKIGGVWMPRRGVKQEIIDDNQILRLRHWFEETMKKEDLAELDKDDLALKALRIDKTKKEKIEVPMLRKVSEDSSYIKVFFIPVPKSPSLVRVRYLKGVGEVFLRNYDWLTGKDEATVLYNQLLKEKHYSLSRTRFADF